MNVIENGEFSSEFGWAWYGLPVISSGNAALPANGKIKQYIKCDGSGSQVITSEPLVNGQVLKAYLNGVQIGGNYAKGDSYK